MSATRSKRGTGAAANAIPVAAEHARPARTTRAVAQQAQAAFDAAMAELDRTLDRTEAHAERLLARYR